MLGIKAGRITFIRPRSVLFKSAYVDTLAEMRHLLSGDIDGLDLDARSKVNRKRGH